MQKIEFFINSPVALTRIRAYNDWQERQDLDGTNFPIDPKIICWACHTAIHGVYMSINDKLVHTECVDWDKAQLIIRPRNS